MYNEIQISMRTWRSPMSAASQGAFVVIPEISLCDISYITKNTVYLSSVQTETDRR